MIRAIMRRVRNRFFPRIGPRYHLLKDNPGFGAFTVGDKSYGNPTVLFSNSGARLKIGQYVSIAENATIMLGGNHRVDWMTTYPLSKYYPEWNALTGHPSTKGDVIIGNDVWIGREALILSGVTIGDGAVVGARAVVAKDVAPYSIVCGNPARHVRYRFGEDVIALLQQLAWWDWPESQICEAAPLLMSNDVTALAAFWNERNGKVNA